MHFIQSKEDQEHTQAIGKHYIMSKKMQTVQLESKIQLIPKTKQQKPVEYSYLKREATCSK